MYAIKIEGFPFCFTHPKHLEYKSKKNQTRESLLIIFS